MNNITLFQPRHTFASEEGEGHIYLPSSLTTVASRIISAGGDVEIQDGNLRKPNFNRSIVGANVVGAPYIPIAIDLKRLMQETLGSEAKLILGGQVISGLTADQFSRLFGTNVFNGNNEDTLKKLLGLELRAMPAPEETSLIPAYEKIFDKDFKKYMEHEFCLYLSQGCKFGCEFCAANRTFLDPVTGDVTQVKERYRNLQIVEDELKYMVERATKLGIKTLDIYLSNLDTFQTPEKLKQFAQIVNDIKKLNPGFTFKMRGLSTAAAFMDTYHQDKETITAMVDAGLWSIGFGVDGVSKEVWKSIKKGHNQKDKCIDAIRLTRQEFGITPEVFMVVGHEKDTPQTLMEDIEFVLDMSEKFGAAPRPYVAKSIVPGNTGWADPKNKEIVDQFIQHPEYFQALDFCALPSSITHPSKEMHPHIIKAFMLMTAIPGNTTHPVYPISPDIDAQTAEIYKKLNQGKFDR